MAFSAGFFNLLIFLIELITKFLCFMKSRETCTLPRSAAASSAVKSQSVQYENPAISRQLSVHLQVAITSCYSQIYHYVNTCNIDINTILQQQSKDQGVQMFSALYNSAMFLQL
jgi:hypothetical protein